MNKLNMPFLYLGLIALCDLITLAIILFFQNRVNSFIEWFEGIYWNIGGPIDLLSDLISVVVVITIFWALVILIAYGILKVIED